ncbi:hypothetical protein RUM43_004475 [Polyplax serrata]|uniref:SUN domain-containing protein n=1 Tax=Polyplax serrata TaxID=468196 RepID=A0AAN8SAX2_POLSC
MEGYCMFESHNNVTEYYKIVSHSAETMLKGIKRIFHHPVKDSIKKQIRINQMNLDDNEVKTVKNIENKIVQDHLKKFLKIEDTKEAFLSDLYKNLLQQNDSTLVSTKNTCTKDEKYIDFYPLTDYALESQGAKILSIFDTEPYEEVTFNIFVNEFQIKNLLLTKFFCNKCPMLVLKAWTGPGDCWAFKGAKGQILIGLSKSIVISAITIDHIRHRNYTIQSAPKQFSVFGVSERNHAEGSGIFLGTFEYKTSGPEVQTFLILPPVEIAFEMVRFKFESNHGNKDYTCVYKIRVHGSPLKVN